MKRIISILLLILGLESTVCYGQSLMSPLKGSIVNADTKEVVPYVSIYCKEMNKGTVSDQNGTFNFGQMKPDRYQFQISSIGYQSLDTVLVLEKHHVYNIKLKPLNMELREVLVIAQESRGNGTSSVVKKEALKHLQPSSFADILELLPGGVSHKNNMTAMKLISLREPKEASGNREYDYNSSFGTSFIIDGQPLSNDAELQNVSGGSGAYITNRNTTGKGIDMRLISTDNIESIEIVRGIPSVKYGELTSGLINIKRSYGSKPLYARIKSDPSSKLFSIGKGVSFSKKNSLNADLDYLDYKSDPRNPKVNYSRITGSLRYGYKSVLEKGRVNFNTNFDYTGSFDESKKDPEIDLPETDKYKNKYNKISLGSSYSWQANDLSFLQAIHASINANYTHNQKNIDKSVQGGNTPIITNREEGEFYSEYLPVSYLSHLVIDGKPLYLYTDISTDINLNLFNIRHDILAGAEWRYSKNFGDGDVYDENRPMYPGAGRPRASKDIPSIQKLSFYMEDKISIPIAKHRLKLQAGLRAVQAIDMSSDYTMAGKFYFDPRVNWSWRFPKFQLFKKDVSLELTGGYGMHTKFPGLTHLYPNLIYFDKTQLSYFSQNVDLRQIQYKTKIVNPINYELKPNENEKFELGFNLKLGQAKAYITGYRELLKNGFKQLGYFETMNYKLYDVASGPKPDELDAPPTVDRFDYDDYRSFVYYNKRDNGAREEKIGIEYQIDLGEFDCIRSRVSINGAWMKTKYDLSDGTYRQPSTIIGDESYPYIGFYNWDKGKEYEQFNTNFRVDTHIKEFGLIFSTAIQCMWYYQYKYNPHDGMPEYYFDHSGSQFVYTKADTQDPVLRFLYDKPDPSEFDTSRTPLGINVNLTVSKTIGEKMELSFYVNRILDYHPDYTEDSGNKVTRKVSPYFGMELNINL